MSYTRVFTCLCLLAGISVINAASLVSRRRPSYPSSNCTGENYLCLNKICIDRKLFCNGINDCGDNSDEAYCGRTNNYNRNNCPYHYPFIRCNSNYRCIPQIWKCDGIVDCPDGSDEASCSLESHVQGITGVLSAITKADNWLRRQADNKTAPNKWGSKALRAAVALYFANTKYFSGKDPIGESVTYEVNQRLLEALIREEMGVDTLSSNDLAVYLHALSASCTNVRDFNGLDLVARLANEAEDTPEQPSPFVLLSLCNAGYDLTAQQIKELHLSFRGTSRTDKLAFALMALSCVADKENRTQVPLADGLVRKLMQSQHKDGSFENVPTTALVMQALIASGEVDGSSFKNAAKYLISQQTMDGSFGSLLNTYYAMPVLRYKSLLDLDTKHCDFEAGKNSKEIEDFQGKFTQRVHVSYSIGIGDAFNLIHTLTLRVPISSTFFDVMKMSAALDEKYRFKYVLLHSKPHIYELCGIQDDAEREKYWYLFEGSANYTTEVRTSPADVVVRDKGNFMMWYRTPEHLRKLQNSTLF